MHEHEINGVIVSFKYTESRVPSLQFVMTLCIECLEASCIIDAEHISQQAQHVSSGIFNNKHSAIVSEQKKPIVILLH